MKIKLRVRDKLLILTFFLVQVFSWIWLHSSLVAKSLSLSKLDSLVIEKKEENECFKKEIASHASLFSIKQRASKLGLVSVQKTVVLWEGERFAYRD